MTTLASTDSRKDPHCLSLTSNASDLIEYTSRIQKAGEARLERISHSLENIIELSKGTALITTTGSDGRNENKIFDGNVSNTEISILHGGQDIIHFGNECEAGKGEIDILMKRIQDTATFIIANIELKHISKDSLSLYKNNPKLVFPTRVWDSYRLWGNEKMDDIIRQIISAEIINDSHLAEKFSDRLRSHSHIAKTGGKCMKGVMYKQFDLEKNEFYYDPERNIEGVKMGPLRVVQYSLALALMRKIRDSGKHPDFINILPRNIPDRLEFLLEGNLTSLSRPETEELQNTYRFFLKMYHQMQYENFTHGTTLFTVDGDTLKDIKAQLSLFQDTLTNKQDTLTKRLIK